jgi:hypothetical protein
MTTKITSANLDNLPNLVDWQAVVSSNTTMVAGKGYFVDSSGGTITMTLPASPSLGDVVAVHALDGASNAVTIDRNSSNIEGATANLTMDSTYAAITFVYSDASNGWVRQNLRAPDSFINATGGTESTSGDYKIHVFNSSSNFVVSSIGNQPTAQTVNYLVVAGGGAGSTNPSTPNWAGGGGGAGGFRTNYPVGDASGLSISAQTYPITVGAGGSNASGSPSVFSTITSAGGGHGAYAGSDTAEAGGSGGGGGAGCASASGAGNTPPVSPPQGNPGGTGDSQPGTGGNSPWGGGGGGGSATAGSNGPSTGGAGGSGTANSITGSSITFSSGGGGGSYGGTARGDGGTNAGSGASPNTDATAATANRGGGGGGHGGPGSGARAGTAGGSGIVVIRYKYQG